MIRSKFNKAQLYLDKHLGNVGAGIGLFIVLGAIFGWVLNIIKLAMLIDDDPVSIATVVIRILGIPLAILGAVVGWF